MTYTVTFYALRPGLTDVVVSVHHLEQNVVAAYTGTPHMVLSAARSVESKIKANGFRVVDAERRMVLDYVDRGGFL